MSLDRTPPTPAFVIAAPASGSGKTVITLGLLRAFAASGTAVASAKVGPDYIDPKFHEAASGRPCLNLDPWAMRKGTRSAVAAQAGAGASLLVVEGVMGLFDGAADGSATTADLAAEQGWPVILVVPAKGQAGSIAATVHGFRSFRPDVRIAGVIVNSVGGPGHEKMISDAMAKAHPDLPVLGMIPRSEALEFGERHLGLVQAMEHADLDVRLDRVAGVMAERVDLARLKALAAPGGGAVDAISPPLRLPGRRIAVASDLAFAFVYPATLDGWRGDGAEVSFFSPLADEAPDLQCDAVYLPGGYPELHAGRLAASANFLGGLRRAAALGVPIFGECGGYMVLGESLVDADGTAHGMAGLLPLVTSFAERRLHLGYRRGTTIADTPFARKGEALRGHEFHYASIVREGGSGAEPLFELSDATGADRGKAGLRLGSVAGSFLHLIDRER